MMRGALCTSLLLLTACSSADPQAAQLQTAEAVASAVHFGSAVPACGSPTRPPDVILALKAGTCLSCRAVGTMTRAFVATSGKSLSVVTPATDTIDVCEYFKREKIEVTILSVDSTLFEGLDGSSDGLAIAAHDPTHYQVIGTQTTAIEPGLLADR